MHWRRKWQPTPVCFFFVFVLFFKYKFIYFNWRLITLQYCIGFAIHQHESAMGVHVFPTPVFLPGESHGQRSLAGYIPWGHKELDTT